MIYLLVALLLFVGETFAQTDANPQPSSPQPTAALKTTMAAVDTPRFVYPFDVVVTAPRVALPVKQTPAAITIVGKRQLRSMPRTIAVDEALASVPGVRIDNQANGSRVHMSMRGQGILSERGIRGIKILLDGLPLNDPSGFAADLYDVDWATVQKIEVLRGPAAALYGGGSSAGVVNIVTEDGTAKPLSATASTTFGSYGFWKELGQLSGTRNDVNYRVSASKMLGDGYRDHTAFWANNLYAKLHWQAAPTVELTPIFAWTDFFNDNAEGLNIDQVRENPRMANPDAIPLNEFQKTHRVTNGVSGQVELCDKQSVQFNAYSRVTRFTEAFTSAVQHRTFTSPGATVQYNLDFGPDKLPNHVSAGCDAQWQTIDEYRLANKGGANEDSLLSKQQIKQRGVGLFVMDRIELTPQWGILVSGRYDDIHNALRDEKADDVDLSGSADFTQATGRAGITYTPRTEINTYVNWGQGFLPPATEELANNPDQYGGFNKELESATSQGEEIGARGVLCRDFAYDVALFHLTTDKDFDRYRGIAPRDKETFYRNAGSSDRVGVETLVSWSPLEPLAIQAAYTYSNFKYTEPDSLDGNWLPNSPEHQLYADIEYYIGKGLTIGISGESQSRWQIDTRNQVSTAGFQLFHAHAAYQWHLKQLHGEFDIAARNIFDEEYIAFTEPDPDWNSYQPGAGRQIFGGLKLMI